MRRRTTEVVVVGMMTVLFATWGLLNGTAHAATVRHLSFAELCDRADLIVRGTVLASASHTQSSGRIVTHHRVRIAERHKPSQEADDDNKNENDNDNEAPAQGARITVVTLGGTDGQRRQHVPGEVRLTRGDDVVLFLRRQPGEGEHWRTVGLAQGALHGVDAVDENNEEVTQMEQRLSGLTLVNEDGNPVRDATALRFTDERFREKLKRHFAGDDFAGDE